jgi:periplasmic divalent cation tolerance protein
MENGETAAEAVTPRVYVVLCTCPDGDVARRLAGGLVEARLAACVNVLPEIRSIYRWQGETCDDAEVLMIIKTTQAACPELERWLRSNHPYEVPEVLALPVEGGSHAYLDWVAQETLTP